jgi:hypothetical protein
MLIHTIFAAHALRATCILAVAALFSVAVPVSAQTVPGVDRLKTTTVPLVSQPGKLLAGENINFTGILKLTSRYVPDLDTNKPSWLLMVDLKNVSASGTLSKKSYVVFDQEEVLLPFAPNQLVDIAFPMTPNEADPLSAAVTAYVRIAVNVDPTVGITSAVATATIR